MKFLSSEVAYWLCKSTMRLFMEYFCHDWIVAPSFYLNIWGEPQKREYRTANHSLETLPHDLNAAAVSLSCRYCFGICWSKLAELFLLPYLSGRSTLYFNRLHDFFVTIPGFYKVVYVSSLFSGTARLKVIAWRMVFFDLRSTWFWRGNAQIFIFSWLHPLREKLVLQDWQSLRQIILKTSKKQVLLQLIVLS